MKDAKGKEVKSGYYWGHHRSRGSATTSQPFFVDVEGVVSLIGSATEYRLYEWVVVFPLSRRLEKFEEVFRDIESRTTRHKRATSERRYLVDDLEYVEECIKEVMK
jgi:hypothetical protein